MQEGFHSIWYNACYICLQTLLWILLVNECIVRAPDDEVVAIALCECKLYQMNCIKMYIEDVANLLQSRDVTNKARRMYVV